MGGMKLLNYSWEVKMKHNHCNGKQTIFIAFILLSIILVGCAAPATPEPVIVPVTGNQQPTAVPATPLPVIAPAESESNSVLSLPDGSKIVIRPKTQVEVISFPNEKSPDVDIILKLVQGDLLVLPNPDSGKWFSVQNAEGNMARVVGCGMVVSVDPVSKDFGMKCIGGNCELGLDSKNMFPVNVNESWVIQQGALHGPTPVDMAQLDKLYDGQLPAACPANIPIPVTGGEVTPTLPPTQQVDIGATATAACKDFKSKFPRTPCP
jgi:hypothetical protein